MKKYIIRVFSLLIIFTSSNIQTKLRTLEDLKRAEKEIEQNKKEIKNLNDYRLATNYHYGKNGYEKKL